MVLTAHHPLAHSYRYANAYCSFVFVGLSQLVHTVQQFSIQSWPVMVWCIIFLILILMLNHLCEALSKFLKSSRMRKKLTILILEIHLILDF